METTQTGRTSGPEPPRTEPVEPRTERLRRHGRRTGLYMLAFSLVVLLVALVALVSANTRQVELSWVVGSGHASLVWVILTSAVLGWLLGIVTSVAFRLRTRRRRPRAGRGTPPSSDRAAGGDDLEAAGKADDRT